MNGGTAQAAPRRTGRGEAFGAVTVLNATATGIGCGLAVRRDDPCIAATWTWNDTGRLRIDGAPDDRLARAVLRVLAKELQAPAGAHVRMASTFPAARGLKTSSGAAAAMVRAALAALPGPAGDVPSRPGAIGPGPRGAVAGVAPTASTDLLGDVGAIVDLAVAACLEAGVTLTGAYDDQLAVVAGGCRLADNLARRDLGRLTVAQEHVAVWVPDAAVDKRDVGRVDLDDVVPEARAAERLARAGHLAQAMTRNGAAFHAAYADAGLPVTEAPVHAALDAGAAGAGLSGTGPAVAALFDAPARLPDVPGGTWCWTEVAHG